MATLRYLTDESGRKTDVVIPMTVWRGLFPDTLNGFDEFDDKWEDDVSEDDDDIDETERIMANPVMYKRLIDAMERMERGEPGIPYEVVRESPIYILTEQERAIESQQLKTILDNLNPADDNYFETVMAEREQADPNPDYPSELHKAAMAKIDGMSAR